MTTALPMPARQTLRLHNPLFELIHVLTKTHGLCIFLHSHSTRRGYHNPHVILARVVQRQVQQNTKQPIL